MAFRAHARTTCLLATVVVIATAVSASARADTAKLLWLGSSSAYFHNAPKDVAEWLTRYAGTSASSDMVGRSGTAVYKYLEPGFPIEYGLEKGRTVLDKIRDGGYDFVILQVPTDYLAGRGDNDREKFLEGIETYIEAIRESGAQPMFYEQGWGDDELFDAGDKLLLETAVKYGVPVAPCRSAWKRIREERPELELHNLPDRVHPGTLGKYVNLCCFHAALTGRSPVGLPVREVSYWPHLTDEEKQAARERRRRMTFTDPYLAQLAGWMQMRSITARTETLSDEVASYFEKIAWETWQDYESRRRAAGLASTDTSDWYVFEPTNTPKPGEIGMQDWIETPAGKHGRITRRRDDLYYNGEPIKLWGINLCYSTCAPDRDLADKRAAFYPKYGINSVRLHKYADRTGWGGIQSSDSFVEFDPDGLDRMDYQVAQLKKAGIYVLLSAHFGSMKLGPADRQYVPYLDEFGEFDGRNRISTPHSAVHYSPELQNVQIRQMVNLLEHKNPYTGLTYADDPAVAFVEVINEQSILFFTSMNPLKASPTLRRQVAGRFSDWLRDRYGSHAGLVDAWGDKAFDGFEGDGFPAVGEHLDKRNILPIGNPWYWDPAQLNGSQSFRRRRLLDTMLFLYQQQCGFYDRYVQAVREAGYEGEVLGSNWQAGRALSHFYNLHSDWRVGAIDRHNYFGGGRRRGPINNATMLSTAGTGTLSVGLQQAVDRPFMLSEWIHVFPNEWGVEGPALLGAYGYGLQGWDVSYMFQNRDAGGFSKQIGRDRWDVTAPQVLGIFPAVARQILRGDVKESDLLAPLRVHVPSLAECKLDFNDRTVQQHDVKTFDTDKVPARALAVARCGVEFTDEFQKTPAFDLAPYEQDGALVSSTGQLGWTEATNDKLGGYFTIDTPGTKAVVGFASGRRFELGNVTIASASPFAAVYVTAAEPDKTIETSDKLLITALGRARNTGMQFNQAGDELLEQGKPPVRLEPIRGTITIERDAGLKVTVLDHDGLRTGRSLDLQGNTLAIDTARDRTPYYLVE